MELSAHAGRSRARAVSIGMLAVAVLLAVTAFAGPGRAETAADRPYTHETLVLGVFFGAGPFADRYPALVLNRAVESDRNLAEITAVIAETGHWAPGLFDRFAAALYGSDRLAIRAAAVDTGQELENTLLRRYPQTFHLTGGGLCNVQLEPYLPSGLDLILLFPLVLWISGCPDLVARDPADRQLDLEIWTDAVATTLPFDPKEIP